MSQKDRQLLLKDLCARLPYGVKIQGLDKVETLTIKNLAINMVMSDNLYLPYLRPMSSMTEEEKKEYNSFIGGIEPYDCDFSAYPIEYKYVYEWDIKNYIDFLIENHFDYRGLIPLGLAIEVTKENNPYEK